MRIVHTESSIGWGGQEIRIARESALFMSAGHDIHVICDQKSTLAERLVTYAPEAKLHKVQLERKRLPELLALARILRELNPDLVVCHSSTDHWLTAVVRKIGLVKLPIVRARHISAPISLNPSTRWLYRSGCDAILTTGESIRRDMINQRLVSSEKIQSIPTGIDQREFLSVSKLDARKRLGVPTEKLLVGIIATLRSWKGHDDLIRAFALMDSSVQLLIVGDGPRRSHLEQLTRQLGLVGRVSFLGQRQDIVNWFAALDVFVLPSYANEGVPQAILQAMATGLPIVTCPVGGIPEAVSKYAAVKLCATRSPRDLAVAIKMSLDDLSQLPEREMLSHSPFSSEWMLDKCQRLYEHAVDEFRR